MDGLAGMATDPDGGSVRDADLVRAVVGGSQEALAGLYDRHGSAVFAAAMRASRDRSIATEVVQETFLALWNRAELFDPTRGALAAWLATIARNRAIDRLRAGGRHDLADSFSSFTGGEADDHTIADWLTVTGELVAGGGPEPLPEAALSDKETRAAIVNALALLEPDERRVIVLAYDEGLTQSEIAATLGWPIGTVKTRTRRALRRLRGCLDASAVGVQVPRRDALPARDHAFAPRREPTIVERGEGRPWPTAVNAGVRSATAAPCG